MAISKTVPAAVVDLVLNKIATATTVVYSSATTPPASVGAISGVLYTRTLVGGEVTVSSGVSVTIAAGATFTAGTSGTVGCVIIHDGTNILLIDKSTTVLTATQQYTPNAIVYTFGQDAT